MIHIYCKTKEETIKILQKLEDTMPQLLWDSKVATHKPTEYLPVFPWNIEQGLILKVEDRKRLYWYPVYTINDIDDLLYPSNQDDT